MGSESGGVGLQPQPPTPHYSYNTSYIIQSSPAQISTQSPLRHDHSTVAAAFSSKLTSVLCSIVARHDSGTAKRREEDGLGVDAITINIKSSPTDHAVNYKNSTNSENEYSHNGSTIATISLRRT